MRRKAIRRGALFYADLDPVIGSEQAERALSSFSKMMWETIYRCDGSGKDRAAKL